MREEKNQFDERKQMEIKPAHLSICNLLEIFSPHSFLSFRMNSSIHRKLLTLFSTKKVHHLVIIYGWHTINKTAVIWIETIVKTTSNFPY